VDAICATMPGSNTNEYVALCHMKRPIHDRKHEAWRPACTVKLVIVIEQMYQKRSSPESALVTGAHWGP
jgi:hypothetical protein